MACCVWLTGLSGAGKSTTARAVVDALAARGVRFALIDGDELRASVPHPLGFSRIDRDTNVLRAGALASAAVSRDEIAVCALISPYAAARERVRQMIGERLFVEILVQTPLNVCAARDPKGLYARAHRGEISGLTGLDDPYEAPAAPALVLGTTKCTPRDNAQRVVSLLVERRLLPVATHQMCVTP